MRLDIRDLQAALLLYGNLMRLHSNWLARLQMSSDVPAVSGALVLTGIAMIIEPFSQKCSRMLSFACDVHHDDKQARHEL